MTTVTGGASAAQRQSHWQILTICCFAQFMVVLDVSVVNVALPAMRSALDLSPSGLQWVVNAYTLTFAGFLMFGGRAADLFGRKKVFLFGLILFTAASLAGGFAQNGPMILIARAFQGLGGAVLAPSTLSVLTTTFTEPGERARALGAWGATAASGGAFGAVVGGLLTDLVSWRWVLFINVPIGVLLALAARMYLTESRGNVDGLRSLDVPGTVTVTGGLTLLVYGIVNTDSHPWGSWQTVSSLIGAVILLAVFVAIEARSDRPLVPLRIFRLRALSAANGITVMAGAAMFGMFFFVSLYLQLVLGYSPLRAGVAFLPASFAIIVGARASAALVGRLGPRTLLLGAPLIAAVGMGWLSRITPDGTYAVHVLGPTILLGLGMGTAMVPATIAGTAGVPHHEAGLASALINTTRQIGAAVGLGVLSTVATHLTADKLAGGATQRAALSAGYGRALAVACGFLVVGVLIAFALPRLPRQAAERDLEEREQEAIAFEV